MCTASPIHQHAHSSKYPSINCSTSSVSLFFLSLSLHPSPYLSPSSTPPFLSRFLFTFTAYLSWGALFVIDLSAFPHLLLSLSQRELDPQINRGVSSSSSSSSGKDKIMTSGGKVEKSQTRTKEEPPEMGRSGKAKAESEVIGTYHAPLTVKNLYPALDFHRPK